MRKRITLLLLIVTCSCLQAMADTTTLTVRTKAKDAKFIGSSIGGAMIIVRDGITGQVLAQGLTRGSTGNTKLIMKTPHERYGQLSDEKTAAFVAMLDIDEPTWLTVEAIAPYQLRESAVRVSTQLWLLPGKHITGDGLVLEIPGFAVSIVGPQAHQYLSKDEPLEIEVNVVMNCGCTISPGGLWDGNQMEVEARISFNGSLVQVLPMQQKEGIVNRFYGSVTPAEPGLYQVQVTAFDPRNGNTGVDKVNFIIGQ